MPVTPTFTSKVAYGKMFAHTFDAIEVINARAFPFKNSVKKAEEAAERLKLSRVAGTDAHYGPQIGYGYTEIEVEEPLWKLSLKLLWMGIVRLMGNLYLRF